MSLLLFAATCLLAFTNGANDNFKGVASLYGSDSTDYRTALAWATVTTFLGSLAAIVLAQGLLGAFSGKGLVPSEVAGGELFLVAVALGAGGTVLLATRLGFPISTTHGLVGAIVGSALVAAPAELDVALLGSTFLAPLLASPFLAVLLSAGLYRGLHRGRLAVGLNKDACLCVGEGALIRPAVGGAAAMSRPVGSPLVVMDTQHTCQQTYAGRFVGVRWQKIIDSAHFVSAGVVSFARGLNDTPKIAALLVVLSFVEVEAGLVVVGVFMAMGGLLSARKVAHTMSRRITTMDHGQGFAANIATGLLVIWASRLGLPVSTTHVSVGSLFGIGLSTGQGDRKVIRDVVLSWVLTLPCAAALAAVSFAILSAY